MMVDDHDQAWEWFASEDNNQQQYGYETAIEYTQYTPSLIIDYLFMLLFNVLFLTYLFLYVFSAFSDSMYLFICFTLFVCLFIHQH